MSFSPHSKIVADLEAVAENRRLHRDGGFIPKKVKPVIWPYDPQMGSTFERQRVDSRYRNQPSVPQLTAVRRKSDKQYFSAETAKRNVPTWVSAREGGEMPLPGAGRYTVPGTFGRHNADSRIPNGNVCKFSTTSRFTENENARTPGVGTYNQYKSAITGVWL